MANFMARELNIKSIFVLDDSGAYGVGLADAFQAQAAKRGITVFGRDRVDPLQADYTPLLTKIRSLNPQALYCGSSALAGVVQPWIERYTKRWGTPPSDYSITAYDAALVLLAAVETVARSGKPVAREAVRDAIQAGKVKTLQGEIAFDANGDMKARVVSVFQVHFNPKYPPNDVIHQFRYIGVAPAEES